jgi:hypothetical protein
MTGENETEKGVCTSFNEWAVQLYHFGIVRNIGTDHLRDLRSEMLHVIGRIDDELEQRDSRP